MLRIRRTAGRTVVLTVSGRLEAGNVDQLCQLIDVEALAEIVVLDLRDLTLADRSVIRLLRDLEARQRVVLRNCPAYIRMWMTHEDAG
jgi:hypothetical protein